MKLRNKVEHIEKAANQQKLKNKFKKGLPIAK